MKNRENKNQNFQSEKGQKSESSVGKHMNAGQQGSQQKQAGAEQQRGSQQKQAGSEQYRGGSQQKQAGSEQQRGSQQKQAGSYEKGSEKYESNQSYKKDYSE